jgi:hypothetical protein
MARSFDRIATIDLGTVTGGESGTGSVGDRSFAWDVGTDLNNPDCFAKRQMYGRTVGDAWRAKAAGEDLNFAAGRVLRAGRRMAKACKGWYVETTPRR